MPTRSRPVLVTGASSGIGRSITELLSSQAREVIATARKRSDLESLARLKGVTPLRLDVTDDDEVGQIGKWIRDSGKGLYGLVNNAGVAGFGALVETPVEELHRVLDVNLYGVHRMTRVCFPFLKASHGRIVNISSMAGIDNVPFFAGYGISKHAVEAYSDLLRSELSGFGVHVSAIEPGNFRSEISASHRALRGPRFAEEVRGSEFHAQMLPILNYVTGNPPDPHRARYPDPRPVAEAVSEALFSKSPKARYLVADDEGQDEANEVYDRVLTKLWQLNEKHPYSLTVEELVARLKKIAL